jgi:outer membrane protein OmpA-like peptidoglycan-associated protein
MRKIIFLFSICAVIFAGCKSLNNTKKGAAIGTVAGAAMGAIVGKATGNTALGAIIGAAVGGTAGVLIGKKMDKQAEEIKKEIPEAEVKRVGEGIEVTFNQKILFDFNSSVLGDPARNNLSDLVTILQKYPDTNIEIQGHTDGRGTDEYNQALSEKRAGVVKDFLVQKGIAANRVKAVGMGEKVPIASNETVEGMAQNRRVEFLIAANEKMKEEAKKEAEAKQ